MAAVIFTQHDNTSGQFIGVITLNSLGNLNALNHEMIEQIQGYLDALRYDDNCLGLIIDSAMDKAFCAGGDVVGLVKALMAGQHELPREYFRQEYCLDLDIHRYPKPIICFAKGIVFGGGMGLMNGCSYRVVTETTHMAMPEISIGLFPDVGGSWFLNKIPKSLGLFLGLTGAAMNGVDALHLGLADYMLASQHKDLLLQKLVQADSSKPFNQVIEQALAELQSRSQEQCGALTSEVKAHEATLSEVMIYDSINELVQAILSLETSSPWLQKAQANLRYGSPLSAALIEQQLVRSKDMTLEEVFAFELELAVACCQKGDFIEGVRALLIDKDRKPNWQHSTIAKVDRGFVESFFI